MSDWAFKIDYDRAIAEDERELARLARIAALGFFQPDDVSLEWRLNAVSALLYAQEWQLEREVVRTALGLTKEQVNATAAWYALETSNEVAAPYLDVAAAPFREGREICERLDHDYPDIPTRQNHAAQVRRAKTRLARHRRNKVKYGD